MLRGQDVPRAAERLDAGASLPESGRNVKIPGRRRTRLLHADTGNQAQIGATPPVGREGGRTVAARLPTARSGRGALPRTRWRIGGRPVGHIVKRRGRALMRTLATSEDDSGVALELSARKGAAYVGRGVVQPHPSNHVAPPDREAFFVGSSPGPHISLQGVGTEFVRLGRHDGDVTVRSKRGSETYDGRVGRARIRNGGTMLRSRGPDQMRIRVGLFDSDGHTGLAKRNTRRFANRGRERT